MSHFTNLQTIKNNPTKIFLLFMLSLVIVPTNVIGKIRGAPNEKPMMLRNAAGQPCLKLRSLTRTDIVIKENYQHFVIIENNCSKTIISKVCYRNSEFSCKQVRTRPYGSETVLLGIRNGYPQFDFDYDEKYLP